jgi:hypothetical protein
MKAGTIQYNEILDRHGIAPHHAASGNQRSDVLGVRELGAGKREGKNYVNAGVGHNKLGVDLRREHPSRRRFARRLVAC